MNGHEWSWNIVGIDPDKGAERHFSIKDMSDICFSEAPPFTDQFMVIWRRLKDSGEI